MTTWEQISEKAKGLTPTSQREVLDFVEFLLARESSRQPGRSAAGLLADLNVDVSDEDIEEARREMWAAFPRRDI
jgi:hypothetical protein